MSKHTQKELVAKAEADIAEDLQKAKVFANMYFVNNRVLDFSGLPSHTKLAALQKTPKGFIKSRRIKNVDIPYVDHIYAEKCLNYVFNFKVSQEIVGTPEWSSGSSKKGTPFVECLIMVKFTFIHPETDQEIVRTVASGHKLYLNEATTKADCLKSAFSKSWTVVAKTFGIGADLHQKETEAYQKVQAEVQVKEKPQPVKKSFDVKQEGGMHGDGSSVLDLDI